MKKSDEIRIVAEVLSTTLSNLEWNIDYHANRVKDIVGEPSEVEFEQYKLNVYQKLYEHVVAFKG